MSSTTKATTKFLVRPTRAKQDWQSVGHTIPFNSAYHRRKRRELHLGAIANPKSSSSPKLIKLQTTIAGKPAIVLIDSGASTSFIDAKFVQQYQLQLQALTKANLTVKLATGKRVHIKERTTNTSIEIDSYTDQVKFMVVPLGECDAILGMTWLKRINPDIDWRTGNLTFQHQGKTHSLLSNSTPAAPATPTTSKSHSLCQLVSAKAINKIFRKNQAECLILASVLQDEQAPSNHTSKEAREILAEFSDVFPDNLPQALPPRRDVDHRIELTQPSPPTGRPVYRMSPAELDELKATKGTG